MSSLGMMCLHEARTSILYITPELLNDPVTVQNGLGESGEEILKWVDGYKFEVINIIL